MRFFTISLGLDQINRSVRGTTVFRPPVPALDGYVSGERARHFTPLGCPANPVGFQNGA
jgi:hypothetical protein